MDKKSFQSRLYVVAGIMGGFFLLFLAVLWNLQMVNGSNFLEQATRRILQVETVDAVRGEILDRNGRVLVSNRSTYQVTLETSFMGKEAERNDNLLALLELCRSEGIEWTDTLPISQSAPFVFTLEQATNTQRRNFAALMEEMGWTQPAAQALEQIDALSEAAESAGDSTADSAPADETANAFSAFMGEAYQSALEIQNQVSGLSATGNISAQPLIDAMRSYYELSEDYSDTDVRALLGVLYELSLRSEDVSTSTYVFAQDVDVRFITLVREHQLKGVKITATTTREYKTSYAAHILGRVGPITGTMWYAEDSYYRNNGYNMNDLVGIDGVENSFEEYLRGEDGQRSVETNAAGKVVGEEWLVDSETGESLAPQPGDNVMLTLDLRLQEALEESLAQRVPTLTDMAEGAAGVVINMEGEVLAMASYPTYDPNIYSNTTLYNEAVNNPLRPFYNRATQGTYSPGSTFKMITGVAALQEGLTTPTEEIYDTGRFQYPDGEHYPYGDYHPACWYYLEYGGRHGWENISEAIRDSCNIYFFTMADRMGIDKINEYAAMFGLGQSTGIELPEDTGLVASPATSQSLGQQWYDGLLLSAAIGQGNTTATPLQLANYIATLVNGGTRYPAHLLKTVKSSDYSEILLENEPEALDTINISQENLEAVKYGMYLLGTEGSVAPYFDSLPVTVGAKTGTAQVGSETAESNAVFVCFAPYEDPEIAIALVAEHGGSGTSLAAIAADILAAYFSADSSTEDITAEGTLLH